MAFLLAGAFAGGFVDAGAQVPKPDLGPNVMIFDPSMPAAEIQERIDDAYAVEQRSEFGPARYALLFLPGRYHVDVPVGFYTQVLGLGATPDAVEIDGNVHSDASLPHNNATCTFWRAAEGFSVTPTSGTMQWAVSQAIPFRRMHVRGNLVLHQNHGWASGGWMSDSLVDGNLDSGSQQQWMARDSEWGSWTGSNWNMVFVGVISPPEGEWPAPPYTKVDRSDDPPDQASYTSAAGVDGWASYKVADGVTRHEAWGLGIYSVFRRPNVNLSRAIEVPQKPGVRFHHMITVALDDKGAIENVIDKVGGPTSTVPRVTPKIAEFPAP